MDPTVSIKEYVDARNDAIESRLSTKLDRLPSTATVWGAVAAIVGSIFTALTIVLASLSFAGDRFDGGMSVSPTIENIRADQAKTDKNQDTKLELMNDKLDVIIQQTSK